MLSSLISLIEDVITNMEGRKYISRNMTLVMGTREAATFSDKETQRNSEPSRDNMLCDSHGFILSAKYENILKLHSLHFNTFCFISFLLKPILFSIY